jgi:hypothetical protein
LQDVLNWQPIIQLGWVLSSARFSNLFRKRYKS